MEIISARPGGREYLRQDKMLLSFIGESYLHLSTHGLYFEERHGVDEDDRRLLAGVKKRITRQITKGQSESGEFSYFHFEAVVRNAIQRFVGVYRCNKNIAVDSNSVLMALAGLNDGKIWQGITKSALIFLARATPQGAPRAFCFCH